MSKIVRFIFALMVAWFGLVSPVEASMKDDVTAVLTKQMEAWNRGDIDDFMTGYLKSPDISYISGGTVVWGYEALQRRYVNVYGDDKSAMGTLSFSDLKISELGKSNALCIGRWHLERKSQPVLDGVYSLVLTHSKDGWKIIHDHTSLDQKKKD
ncbi:MAG: nuclear transport factor 2 family protein [Candidatus Obscuribacterales bacterium]|nr:nuclear transport factor 2 family protein [Candidatus Obscuribacterales bacterium]